MIVLIREADTGERYYELAGFGIPTALRQGDGMQLAGILGPIDASEEDLTSWSVFIMSATAT